MSRISEDTPLRFYEMESGKPPASGLMQEVARADAVKSFNLGLEISLADMADPSTTLEALDAGLKTLKADFESLLANETLPVLPQEAMMDLNGLVEQFKVETGYPDDRALRAEVIRQEWASLLQPNAISALQKVDFRKMIAGSYGSPGPQSILNTTVTAADDEEWQRLLRTLNYLLWGEDPVEVRIDRVLDITDLGFRGLKESVTMKLLAIVDPGRFGLIYPLTGQYGKAMILRALDQSLPSIELSVGNQHVQANDAIRRICDPLLPGDPLGQMAFLYWYLRADQENGESAVAVGEDTDSSIGVEDRLLSAASDLYVDGSFLLNIHALLAERRQVIFYGPPGTGKTYFAQKIAEAVSPEESKRVLVQFHPAMAYEDFFEGYRPSTNAAGSLTYELMPGPLRSLADAAATDPTSTYILIIDEINRANLPKVFGELLFLLEYRQKAVRLTYEPDSDFTLPENLWIIGTMNTSDRSIGILDAAMRRRFHFIPFVPDSDAKSPIAGVLRRWTEETGQLVVLPDLVDRVNNLLRNALGGDHLLLGPSYFMQDGIDELKLRRIWEYQIEPLIDDLFFGDSQRAAQFAFDQVWDEFKNQLSDDLSDE
jgi:5-methylcytosine-specific restriction protein B